MSLCLASFDVQVLEVITSYVTDMGDLARLYACGNRILNYKLNHSCKAVKLQPPQRFKEVNFGVFSRFSTLNTVVADWWETSECDLDPLLLVLPSTVTNLEVSHFSAMHALNQFFFDLATQISSKEEFGEGYNDEFSLVRRPLLNRRDPLNLIRLSVTTGFVHEPPTDFPRTLTTLILKDQGFGDPIELSASNFPLLKHLEITKLFPSLGDFKLLKTFICDASHGDTATIPPALKTFICRENSSLDSETIRNFPETLETIEIEFNKGADIEHVLRHCPKLTSLGIVYNSWITPEDSFPPSLTHMTISDFLCDEDQHPDGYQLPPRVSLRYEAHTKLTDTYIFQLMDNFEMKGLENLENKEKVVKTFKNKGEISVENNNSSISVQTSQEQSSREKNIKTTILSMNGGRFMEIKDPLEVADRLGLKAGDFEAYSIVGRVLQIPCNKIFDLIWKQRHLLGYYKELVRTDFSGGCWSTFARTYLSQLTDLDFTWCNLPDDFSEYLPPTLTKLRAGSFLGFQQGSDSFVPDEVLEPLYIPNWPSSLTALSIEYLGTHVKRYEALPRDLKIFQMRHTGQTWNTECMSALPRNLTSLDIIIPEVFPELLRCLPKTITRLETNGVFRTADIEFLPPDLKIFTGKMALEDGEESEATSMARRDAIRKRMANVNTEKPPSHWPYQM